MPDIFAQAEEARERGLMLARERACYLYTSALDAGDMATVAAILRQAEQDTELDAMLQGIEAALHEEMELQPPERCFICGGPLLPLPGSFCPVCDLSKPGINRANQGEGEQCRESE